MEINNSSFEMVIIKVEKFDSEGWLNSEGAGDNLVRKDYNCEYPIDVKKIKSEELESPLHPKYICDKPGLILNYNYFYLIRKENEDPDQISRKEEFPIDINLLKTEDISLAPEDIELINAEDYMQIYPEKKPYKCDVCSHNFRQKKQIRIHMQIHLREQPYSCDICFATFNLKGNLSTHLKIHEDKHPHTCNICSAQFKTERLHDKHLQNHNKKSSTCYFCYSKFGSQKLLKDHMRIHVAENIRTCDVCHSKFSTTSSLKQHIRIHTGEKPHQCDVCEKRFTARSNYMRHMKTHSIK
ncbi:zinc finger protein 239-like isoform X2 [Cotesia glomerata]|uniref:zinc finger protein 239-like isoform X2 n=1 Tax=Cotesia glomerata TaxID=32391 RepID=UPI001D00BF38|nr:zinc finger protein 239-like isoform X2 [Cotesia glomerata]